MKVDLFQDEVYVFTPKGDVRVFPRGSSPIDFAYAIHSEVGDHCSGARVNGAIAQLRYKLRNGDVVEVMTNPGQHPSKDWLEYNGRQTGRARSKITRFPFWRTTSSATAPPSSAASCSRRSCTPAG